MLEDSFAGYRSLGWQLSVSITWLWLLPLMVSCFWGEAKHCLTTEQSLLVALRFFSLGHKSLMMSIYVGLFGHFQWEAELFGYVVCLFFGCFGHSVLIFSASSVCTDWLFLHAHWPLRCCSFLSVFVCSVLECSPVLSPYWLVLLCVVPIGC